MSTFDTMAAQWQLYQAALEEGSRFGQDVDLDHLFLALLVTEQAAGEALRALGLTLTAGRQAVVDRHGAHLATLGIEVDLPQRPISFDATGDHDWTPRARALLAGIKPAKTEDYSIALLQALLAEPSGVITELLQHLDADPDAIWARLADVRPESSAAEPSPDARTGSRTVFVPASVEQVWAFLVNPATMCEWGPLYERVDHATGATGAQPGDRWVGHVPPPERAGRAASIKPKYRRQAVEMLARSDQSFVSWCFTYPDAPDAKTCQVGIGLTPVDGGTKLRLDTAWQRPDGPERKRWPVLGRLLAPLHRYAVWMELDHLGSSISRAFR